MEKGWHIKHITLDKNFQKTTIFSEKCKNRIWRRGKNEFHKLRVYEIEDSIEIVAIVLRCWQYGVPPSSRKLFDSLVHPNSHRGIEADFYYTVWCYECDERCSVFYPLCTQQVVMLFTIFITWIAISNTFISVVCIPLQSSTDSH